jgi:UPF0176 protein
VSIVTNISAYRFARIGELKSLRERLIAFCRERNLRGTILLSTEGINLFVAGLPADVEELLSLLRAVPGLEGLEPKVSESREQPFNRMLVKIKKEIIAFGVESIDPVNRPAPRISAQQLKQWLDKGRPVMLLDTRNDFEVQMGTFRQAVAAGIQQFRDFPAAVEKLSRDNPMPIVTFCTGGIRCEKAAPYLIEQGFENVYQLDGGILKYFEECGSEHYEGECFVFDKRVGLSADLQESGHGLCFVCQTPLAPEELADPHYVEGVSCPRCYSSPEEQQAKSLAEHTKRLKQITHPLPGREPKDNYRPLRISARHAGFRLIDFLADVFPHTTRAAWQNRCEAEEFVDGNHHVVRAEQIVQPGEQYFSRERMQIEPDVNADITILHEDTALIVVNKPAPLPMHPSGRFNRNSLQSILREVYAPQKPRPAHRLDANTSGVAVFTRTSTYANWVQSQFERGQVHKVYLARVVGHPPEDRFSCRAAISNTAGQNGSRIVDDQNGLPAHSDFELLERFSDGTALVRVEPRTGRTNQIRIHLWHLGWPIVGDGTYCANGLLGDLQTLSVDDQPMNLHAWRVTFRHPLDGRQVTFEAPRPDWAEWTTESGARKSPEQNAV